jgi:integrase
MPRKAQAKVTGVWEKVSGSGVWWIRYRVAGQLKREKVGRKSDAADLYRQRKSELRAGVKLPANLRAKGITFAVLAEDALHWYAAHGKKDTRNVTSRMKPLVLKFGEQAADKITPAEIDRWISDHTEWTPATCNRYKALLSKTFKLALASGKVTSNPARLVEARKESAGRIRYLLPDEETRIREVITRRFPLHLPAFIVALKTGMRLSEQFSLEWEQVDFDRKRIYLDITKNGSSREIPISKSCREAFDTLHSTGQKGRVFQSKYGEPLNNPRAWFELAIEEAKIPDFTWHCLRYTFCSRLIMKGVDLKTAQTLMGHKTISMTARYAHLSAPHLDAAIEKLDE